MSESLGAKTELILQKLTRLDAIEASAKNIDYKLKNLEERTAKLESFRSTATKEIKDTLRNYTSRSFGKIQLNT